MGIPLLEIEKELARQRMSEAGKIGRAKQLGVSSKEPTPTNGRSRDIVAKKINLSPTTFQRATTIIQKGSKTDKEKLQLKVKSTKYTWPRWPQ